MIRRIWRGRTKRENADAYEALLLDDVLPGIAARGVPGYRGASLLRRDGADGEDGAEFVTILDFESLEAVRAFAGDDPEAAYVPDRARALLSSFDERSAHYAHVADVPPMNAASPPVAGTATSSATEMSAAPAASSSASSPAALADAIRAVAGGDAWHGPSLRAALEGLEPETAAAHPIPRAHSILELVLHVGAWAEIVGERVRGEGREVTRERNFPTVGSVTEDDWEQAVRTTLERLETLARQVEALGPEDLGRELGSHTAAEQIRGVAEHTAYHIGQIMLLRRAAGATVPPS